jgi:hypothetical protein
MQTLRRELRLKFMDIVKDDALADRLADAALSVAGISKPFEKKGDIMDGILAYSEPDPTESVLVELERQLHANIPRNNTNRSVARFIMKMEKEGQSLDNYMKWLKNEEWRVAHLYQWASNLDKIRLEWPQAFVAPEDDPDYDPRMNNTIESLGL